MLKRFSTHCTKLDGGVDDEFLENGIVFDLERYQIAVETDEQLKEYCYPLLKRESEQRGVSIDEFYDYLAKKYPYDEMFSYYSGMTEEQMKIFGADFMRPMKR